MKRLINYVVATTEVTVDTSMFAGTPFKCDTDTSYYNDFLNDKELEYKQNAKNRTGEIVMMSPNEYYEYCSKDIFNGRHSVEQLKHQREYSKFKSGERFVDRYIKDMLNGDKFPLCYLNFADSSQEGLHRMYAAGEAFGWNTKFPVLVVTPYDQEVENRWKTIDACKDFERYYFSDICEEAADKISDWHNPPPENFIDIYHDKIIEVASTFTDEQDGPFNIDVVIEIEQVEDHPQVQVYLSKFESYELPSLSQPYTIWLEDLYDLGQYDTEEKDDISDDIDLESLFFK